MARLNVPVAPIHTHEGGRAKHITPETQLRRSVMSCMLWEDEFYEDGKSIADRIVELVPMVDGPAVRDLAIAARSGMNLRHVPLLLAREMARSEDQKKWVGYVLENIIQRPDELCEFLAIYWKDKKQPLSAQVKKGLAAAFQKFSEYQLGKYNRDNAIKLRDVLFLCHAKPKNLEQEALWKRLINGTLATPDTWEVALSDTQSEESKKDRWERLLRESKLGGMALLRNLRNMTDAGVEQQLIENALVNMKPARILPFRFIAAARYAPHLESHLESGMLNCLSSAEKLPGRTVLLIDVSGSMEERLSGKSELTRMDAACGVAMLAREICESVDVFAFSLDLVRVPPRRGFALRDAIVHSQEHSGTLLGPAVKAIYSSDLIHFTVDFGVWYGGQKSFTFKGFGLKPDRLIVITDEQSHTPVGDPDGRGYMINVASAKNGVGYGAWMHIDGWSESVIRYIQSLEELGK